MGLLFYSAWCVLIMLCLGSLWWFHKRVYMLIASCLRFLALGLLLIFSFLNDFQEQGTSPKLYVLLDTSVSVQRSLKLPQSPSYEKLLTSPTLKKVMSHYSGVKVFYYDLYDLDLKIQSWDRDQKVVWKYESEIQEALQRFLEWAELPQKSRILLLSDGHDTTRKKLSRELTHLVQEKQLIVDYVNVVAQSEESFVALSSVYNPQVGFLDTPMTLAVELDYQVQHSESVKVTLTDGKRVYYEQQVLLDPEQTHHQSTITWTPTQPGFHMFLLQITPEKGAQGLPQHMNYFSMDIRPKKQRVLHIAGRPSHDVMQLRSLLRATPEVDLIAFYILRDPYKTVAAVPEHELALIRFPVEELFQRELYKFDVVIFHNFDIAKYLRNLTYQKNFQKYLSQGKTIIVVGGEQVLNFKRYQKLFLPPNKSNFRLSFQKYQYEDLMKYPSLFSTFLMKQPTFAAAQKLPQSAGDLLQMSYFDEGMVIWVQDPVMWQWGQKEKNIAKPGYFDTFWSTLLSQIRYKDAQVFKDFHRVRPYIEGEMISGTLDFTGYNLDLVSDLFLQIIDPNFDQVVFEEKLKFKDTKAYVELPALSPGIYDLQVSCMCAEFKDHTHTLRVVRDWIEVKTLNVPSPWLGTLVSDTGGNELFLNL